MNRSDLSSFSMKPPGSEPKKSMFLSVHWRSLADEFERSGMQSLFSSGAQGGARETGKTLPPEIRQLIVDLHAELAIMSWREIAEVCYIRYGRRPDHNTNLPPVI